MTFSIVAADPAQEEVGVAVQSKFLAVGAVVPWARAGIGGVATQAFAEFTFGPRGLSLMADDLGPDEVLTRLLADDPLREQRQVGVVTADGRAASFTGADCFDHASSLTGAGFAAQGNILAGRAVVEGMADAFQTSSSLRLVDRLLAALRKGQAAGGDQRGQQSAALLVVRPGGGYGGTHDRWLDLRVDDHPRPIDELAHLVSLHRLHFERADPTAVVTIDAPLQAELAALLNRHRAAMPGRSFGDALYAYLGWENLETRWIDGDRIDPVVLDYIRTNEGGHR